MFVYLYRNLLSETHNFTCSIAGCLGIQGDLVVRMRLFKEDRRIKGSLHLNCTSRKRAAAEKVLVIKELAETEVLMFATEKGDNIDSFDPETALALARATRDVLAAEEEVANLRVEECRLMLETLQDAVDFAHTRLEDAESRIGHLLSTFQQENLSVDLQIRKLRPSYSYYPDPELSNDVDAMDMEEDEEDWQSSHSDGTV